VQLKRVIKVLRRIKYKFHQFRFQQSEKLVLKTPAAQYRKCPSVTIVSMVSHSTVCMYLLAIKSFLKHFGYGTIEAIDDGSLTEEDKYLLSLHVPAIRISSGKTVNTYDCPSYISWKRLFRIREIAETSYVIQLDSDTVSVGNLVDIHHNVQSNDGFVIGSQKWSKAVDVIFLNGIVSQWDSDHVQARAESCFHLIDFFKDGTKYLRGCAGFAGYPQNFATVDEIRALSASIEEHVGDDWMRWGSEQTATLCLISKQKTATILPWPEYQNYGFPNTNEISESMNFIHFIGSKRFDDSQYLILLKKFVNN
jgi:hypothetical protein